MDLNFIAIVEGWRRISFGSFFVFDGSMVDVELLEDSFRFLSLRRRSE